MNNDRSKVEQHARNLVRVFFELFASQETIKQGLWLWKSSGLHRLGSNRPGIWGISSSDLGPESILERVSCDYEAQGRQIIRFQIHRPCGMQHHVPDSYRWSVTTIVRLK